MKTLKTIFIFLFTIAIVNAGYSQISANYKQPYNGTLQQNRNSFESSATNDNYKQPEYKVRSIQEVTRLICCAEKTANSFFSASNYKQPYSRSIENSCRTELVCNGKTTLECCKN